jgi:hypothetical protein
MRFYVCVVDGSQEYKHSKLRGYGCKCAADRRDAKSGEPGGHSPAS